MRTQKWKLDLRLFFLLLILIAIGVLLTRGLSRLTIEDTAAYTASVRQVSEVTTYQSGMRGTITDRNGVVLAYDETTYNVVFYRDPDNTSPADSARYTDALMRAVDIIGQGGGEVIDTFYIVMQADGTYVYDFGVTSEQAIAARKARFVDACRFSNPDLTAEEAYLILRESWQIPDDMPYQEARKIMSIRQEAVLNSYRAFEGVTIAYGVSLAVVAELDGMQDELTGIKTEKSSYRVYPQGNTASHIIGYLGRQVTTDMESLGYSFDRYAPFTDVETTNSMLDLGYSYEDSIGVAGVEKTMEAYLTANLRSRQGQTQMTKNLKGAIVDVLSTTTPGNGLNVRLTIDLELQRVTEQALLHNIQVTNAKQQEKLADSPQKYLKLRDDLSSIKMAETGAAIVMDVRTGDVLALASYPDFDPNLFTDGVDSAELEQLYGENSNQPTLNRAIAIRTAPGSVFKMATGFAGLMEGAITPDSRISDQSPYYYFVGAPTVKVSQNAPSCWTSNRSRHANLNLSRALTVSCNYFFFTVADRVGIDRLVHWSGELGLSDKTNIELPGELSVQVGGQAARYDFTRALSEQSSSMPRLIYNQIVNHLYNILEQNGMEADKEAVKRCAARLLQLQRGVLEEHGTEIRQIIAEELNIPVGISQMHPAWIVTISTWLEELRWKPTYTIRTGIGQGVMLLTPLSVTRYAATIANRGTVYDAHLVDSILYDDGRVYDTIEPTVRSTVDAPASYWDAILEGLKGVVSPEDGGTASSVFSNEFERKGYLDRIIGKTGTAQTSASNNVDIENTCWFVAIAPREAPEIAVVVFIQNGLSGSSGAVAVEDIVTYWIERGGLG